MAESDRVSHVPNQPIPKVPPQSKSKPVTHAQRLSKIYQLPAPLRTYPLPTFVPHNPLSLVHILFTWLSQLINPRPSHILPIYQGWFSPETRSVHVTDYTSVRGLWEQGFYGKGSLSRSEPNWLEGEKARRENKDGLTSEEFTRKRRAERQKLKWERARKERQAIDQQLLQESNSVLKLGEDTTSSSPEDSQVSLQNPINKANQVLHLEDSHKSLCSGTILKVDDSKTQDLPSVGSEDSIKPIDDILLIKDPLTIKLDLSQVSLQTGSTILPSDNDRISNSSIVTATDCRSTSTPQSLLPTEYLGSNNTQQNIDYEASHVANTSISRSKENSMSSTTDNSDPPGLSFETREEINEEVRFANDTQKVNQSEMCHTETEDYLTKSSSKYSTPIKNEEHLQLTFEEAFFLTYALGCLCILDPATKRQLSIQSFFRLCRQYASFTPSPSQSTSPDNIFMTNYVVYHHFRSLGWVVRSGIKFSVDYMLYNRGPVFSHAEFSVLILPSYSDPYWSSTAALAEYSRHKQYRSWAWMSCINRVISQVKKTLILCYVEIPQPLTAEDEDRLDLKSLLARYKIREFIISRFLTNRMRMR